MEIIKLCGHKLTNEERETLLNYDNIKKAWIMDSTVPKHFRKALKQGWTPIKQYIYEDNMVFGMTLIAPDRSVSIRNVNKKNLSEKQLNNLSMNDE